MTDIRRKRYDATELKRLYLEEKLTTTDLALRFRVYPMTICRWLEKTGIDRRRRGSPGESIPDQTGREKKIRATPMGEMGQFKKNHARFRRKQKAELEKRRRLKVQRHHETDRFREEQNRDIRSLYEIEGLTMDAIGERLRISPSCVSDRLKSMRVEKRRRGPIRREYTQLTAERLEKMHVVDELPIYCIANYFKVGSRVVANKMRTYGISISNQRLARRKRIY